ncbi:MAG: hypothetical protein EAZ36_02585, partial [Verrucomicrobia bacterium]
MINPNPVRPGQPEVDLFIVSSRCPMHDKTFAELYCERRGLSPHEYTEAVLKQTLYPQARMLKRFLPLVASRHFASDVEFVNSVGLLRRFRDYTLESEEFAHHPE